MAYRSLKWKGRVVEDLTRDELIEAIYILGEMIRKLNSPLEIKARAIGKVEMIKRKNKK